MKNGKIILGVVIFITMVVIVIFAFSNQAIEEDSVIEEIPESNVNTEVVEMLQEGEYDCIASVNCMPIVPKDRIWACSSDYINWAIENCTDFEVYR